MLPQSSSKEGDGGDNGGAMFTKRPVTGWSCASCDKDVVNL